VRRLVATLLFLTFVNDSHESTQTVYSERMFAPFSWMDAFLVDPLPFKIRPVETIFLIVLIMAGAKGSRVGPMRSALMLALVTTVFFFLYGVMLKGGDSRAASWQVYLLLAGPLTAFAVAATHTTAAHFRTLAKVFLAAAMYRAIMCLIFYFAYVRNSTEAIPPVMTTHHDTVLWVSAIGILLVGIVEKGARGARLAVVCIPMLLLAIQYNNRRLAWVSLVFSLATMFFLLPPSKIKRKVKRMAMVMVPILGLYVAIGWGQGGRIFAPIQSLQSMSAEKPDPSTLARNAENLSLIATAAAYGPSTGTGWGHKYIELTNKYSIAEAMELWPYVPHNSILGLFAYTGFLGVLGYWMMFVTAMFLHARMARTAVDPQHVSVGLVGAIMMVTSLNQMFGDMGSFSLAMYVLGISWAAAMRVPIEAGVWPDPRQAAPAASAPGRPSPTAGSPGGGSPASSPASPAAGGATSWPS
jgi:hypothetical protein